MQLERALPEAERQVLAELEPIRIWLSEALTPASPGSSLARAVVAAHAQYRGRHSVAESGIVALISRRRTSPEQLRLAMALLAVMERTDRMMAQCVSIVTLRNLMRHDAEPCAQLLACTRAMGDVADEQIAGAGRVFADRDLAGLTKLRDRDRKLCELNRRCLALAERGPAGDGTRNASSMATLVARSIERIGDGAVGIGRQAAFVATGVAPPAIDLSVIDG